MSFSSRLVQRAFRRSLLVSVLAGVGTLASGCGSEGGKQIEHPPEKQVSDEMDHDVRLTRGPYSLTVERQGINIVLRRQDEELLRFPSDGLQLGAVQQLSQRVDYDPYGILGPKRRVTPVPAGLRWLSLQGAKILKETSSAVVLGLRFDEEKRATLAVRVHAAGRFSLHIQVDPSSGPPVALYRLHPRVDAREAFYGLGEYFDEVNHRGHVRAMQLETEKGVDSGYNEAHVPVPLLIGTRGWGLFVQSRYPGAFDVASKSADRVDVMFGMGTDAPKGLTFHLLAADHPEKITGLYYQVTGKPKLPAPWALGPWVWRDENDDQAQVENDLRTIRKLDLATSGYWIDRPYATAVNTFDFDPKMFDDPAGMIARAHALGFRMALWHVPYIDKKSDATAELRQQAKDKGYYPPTIGAVVTWGPLIDFTNPEAVAWWQNLLHNYTDMGIEGFKLDYAEDMVTGLFGKRNVWVFHDGSDERTMHARYQKLYHRVYGELLPKEGGFLLCRAGTYGDQTNGVIIWPGDIDSNMVQRGEEAVDRRNGKKYRATGGLPAAVVAGLTLGVSGFPFFGSDTGGYRHAPPDKETFVRWFEHTALSSVMQVGTNSNDVAWEPTKQNGFDQEVLDLYRRYTRLHLRLFPYEWTMAKRIGDTGLAIQRPVGLAYPELGEHPSDEYLFGDRLLVAPVVERGARERQVLFPPGRWVNWWTGERVDGPATEKVAADLGTLPLFVKEGTIVPLLRPTVDTLAPTTHPDEVDSYANRAGVLYARVTAGKSSSFRLFDGMRLSQKSQGAEAVLTLEEDGSVFREGVVFELFGAIRPELVTMDGKAVAEVQGGLGIDGLQTGWKFVSSERGGMVQVRVPAGKHEVRVHWAAN